MIIINRFNRKTISLLLLISFAYELFFPTICLALTSGPSQPEVESFTPITSNDMVDLFTGDFNYNIPLFEIGDYPINLIYNSNPTSDQEASWVGLGWNLNPGSITRTMRGLPDDFKGDIVEKKYNIKENKSWGVELGVKAKIFGMNIPPSKNGDGGIGFNLGLSANNYKGYGLSTGVSATLSASKSGQGKQSASLGLQFSSQDGVSISAQANMEGKDKENSLENSIGLGYNTRAGMKELTLSSSTKEQYGLKSVSANAASISFATPSFTPSIMMPMHNNSYTLAASVGGEVIGLHGNISITGYWAKQSLESPNRNARSYGYLNSSDGAQNTSALMDFNREKDITYTKNVPVLAIPNYTYDLFKVSGQGISGQYRPHRGDVGVLFDGRTSSGSESTQAGIQLGTPSLVHGGGNINQTSVSTTTNKWTNGNSLLPNIDFAESSTNLYFEESYFKRNGEFTSKDENFYSMIGNNDPLSNTIGNIVRNLPKFNRYNLASNSPLPSITIGQKLVRAQRDKREELFTYLNGSEASKCGLDKDIPTFTSNGLTYEVPCVLAGRDGPDRMNQVNLPRSIHPTHHISEVSIIKKDGKKYVYGIPAYNNTQLDVTFACKDTIKDPIDGLITYSPNIDDVTKNGRGLDNYFSSEKIPAYAYAYLLTGVLSPDYQDVTGNGITNDDVGEAIRFNYSRSTDAYNWRIPYQENKANINTGLKAGNGAFNSSVGGDAKGSYTYGTKELWYVHSIESRTMIAMFYTADREDGLGVKGMNGGHSILPGNTERQKLLSNIKIFSKSDLLKYGPKAVPIKTIHFVYDYSLCPEVPNNTRTAVDNSNGKSYYTEDSNVNANHGKLTLKQVYFTYGHNTRGQLSSYRFTYQNFNPAYGMKNYDRWGNYKNNTTAGMISSNAEYPYTLQDTTFTNNFIRAYNLEHIDLPSGGRISVQLESDDYAYVQDKKAGQMYFVSSFGRFSQTSPYQYIDDGSNLYYGEEANDILVINVGENSGDVFTNYLEGIEEISYRFDLDLGSTSVYDFISGYASLNKIGTWYGKLGTDRIWVKIKKVNNKFNPISHYAWQFMRNNYPELIYPGSSDPGNNLGDALIGLLGSFSDIVTMVTGFSNHAVSRQWAKKIQLGKSWVRLNNKNNHKLGGGSRVKKITINDNWNLMAPSGIYKEYSQEYLYSDTSNGQNISTGVANWEPIIGQDENPFRKPIWYEVKRPLMENDHYFMEEPFGESFFPSPVVGYSKVTVANANNQHIRRTATGYTINQFYTAKDFPTITARTKVDSKKFKPPFKLSFLGSLRSLEKWLVSQGVSIELNDMHGKQKAIKICNASGHEISSVYYYYNTETLNGKKRLSSRTDIISQNGNIVQNADIGEDIDFYMDMREQSTITSGVGADINVEGFILPFFIPLFLVVPPIIPKFTRESVYYRSAVGMKITQRYGILDKVVETKDGSTITSKNLCRDSETGEVLLTSTQNDFNDPVFNWTYPAHWAYRNMGPAYSNIGLQLGNVQVDNGQINNLTNAMNFLNEGDKILVLLPDQTPYKLLTVGRHAITSGLCLLDGTFYATIKDGNNNLLTCNLKVVESGKKNMSSAPIGNLTTLKTAPIDSTTMSFSVSSSTKIIDCGAQEYLDKWKINCGDLIHRQCDLSRPNFCLDNFINLILTYNSTHSLNLFENCTNQVSVGDLYRICNCQCQPDSINGQNVDDMVFKKLNCGRVSPQESVSRGWKMGNCFLFMNSLSGNAINLDSLQIINPIGQDSSWTKVYVGQDHSDSVSFSIECYDCYETCEPLTLNDSIVFDPYLSGMLNNWHPSKSWKYLVDRDPSSGLLEARSSGSYISFTPFWTYDAFSHLWSGTGPTNDDKWINSNTVTRINRLGKEVENKNVLDNYSAALYGYDLNQAIAISKNSKYKQIANDNFEDYYFQASCLRPCYADHWNFSMSLATNQAMITDSISHTGKNCLFVDANQSTSVYRDILYRGDDSLLERNLDTGAYYMHNGCIDKFSPDSGKYIFGGWVKETQPCGSFGYIQDSIKISFTGSSQEYTIYPSGVVVEGWQRFEESFNVPSSATGITVSLFGGATGAYFDDLRIHPYHASMKTYVYDPRSMKLMAELDENNYATFYEYSDEGILIRIKKETERGIMTLKEARSSNKRQ